MQEPVSTEPPLKLAVPISVFVYATGTVASTPLMVVAAVFALAVDEAVLLFPPVVRLNGEHPTKLGAVELTAAHSWILNWIAASICQ